MLNNENWLIPFKGENVSGCFNQNFLWKKDSLYIMDNHRAAIWCWFQHISLDKRYNFFHIDRHYDTLYSNIDIWKKLMPDMKEVSLNEYLNICVEVGNQKYPLFSWNNYLSLFLECYAELLDTCYFATYKEGDTPRFNNCREENIWDMPLYMDSWISESKVDWIFNIDIDYFIVNGDYSFKLFSDDFLKNMFMPIVNKYNEGKIAVITMSLSPECSGGWGNSLNMCKQICNIFDINFDLAVL